MAVFSIVMLLFFWGGGRGGSFFLMKFTSTKLIGVDSVFAGQLKMDILP